MKYENVAQLFYYQYFTVIKCKCLTFGKKKIKNPKHKIKNYNHCLWSKAN